MPKTILVPISGSDGDKAVLAGAHLAAHMFDSHIECLFVRVDIREMLARTVALNTGVPVITPELWSTLEGDENDRGARARSNFEAFCNERTIPVSDTPLNSHGVSASWRDVTGDSVRRIVCHARINELTVLGLAPELAVAPRQVGDVLMESGRPLLLVPKPLPRTLATTVAIAWKETAEAARTLTAAMPFFAKAGKVVIISADERGSHSTTVESAERLKQALRWNGIDAELRRLAESSDVPAQILDAVSRESADLLVMGGYTHSRAREFVFGGLTRRVLHSANLPVLMCH